MAFRPWAASCLAWAVRAPVQVAPYPSLRLTSLCSDSAISLSLLSSIRLTSVETLWPLLLASTVEVEAALARPQ